MSRGDSKWTLQRNPAKTSNTGNSSFEQQDTLSPLCTSASRNGFSRSISSHNTISARNNANSLSLRRPGLSRSISTQNTKSTMSTMYASSNKPLQNRDIYKKDIARKVSEHKLQSMLGDVSFNLESERKNAQQSNSGNCDKEPPLSAQEKSMNKLKDLLGEDVSFSLRENHRKSRLIRRISRSSLSFSKAASAPIVASSYERNATFSSIAHRPYTERGNAPVGMSGNADFASTVNESFPTTSKTSARANPFQNLLAPALLNTEELLLSHGKLNSYTKNNR